jgi:hypothetical protein
MLAVSLKDSESYWLLIITGPFAFFLFWISRTFVSALLNACFSTTRIDTGDISLSVYNQPFGDTFTVPYKEIASVHLTDLMSRKICLELILRTRSQRVYRVAAFQKSSQAIEELYGFIQDKTFDHKT